MKVPLILQNELVSTQTDLNPNDSTFEKYKKSVHQMLFFNIFPLYLFGKEETKLYFLMFISFIFAIIYNFPNQKRKKISEDLYIFSQ